MHAPGAARSSITKPGWAHQQSCSVAYTLGNAAALDITVHCNTHTPPPPHTHRHIKLVFMHPNQVQQLMVLYQPPSVFGLLPASHLPMQLCKSLRACHIVRLCLPELLAQLPVVGLQPGQLHLGCHELRLLLLLGCSQCCLALQQSCLALLQQRAKIGT